MMKLLSFLGLVEQPAQPGALDAVALFMHGWSIPRCAAEYGGDMIAEQREVEQQIREYIRAQDADIQQLEAQISELQQAAYER